MLVVPYVVPEFLFVQTYTPIQFKHVHHPLMIRKITVPFWVFHVTSGQCVCHCNSVYHPSLYIRYASRILVTCFIELVQLWSVNMAAFFESSIVLIRVFYVDVRVLFSDGMISAMGVWTWITCERGCLISCACIIVSWLVRWGLKQEYSVGKILFFSFVRMPSANPGVQHAELSLLLPPPGRMWDCVTGLQKCICWVGFGPSIHSSSTAYSVLVRWGSGLSTDFPLSLSCQSHPSCSGTQLLWENRWNRAKLSRVELSWVVLNCVVEKWQWSLHHVLGLTRVTYQWDVPWSHQWVVWEAS